MTAGLRHGHPLNLFAKAGLTPLYILGDDIFAAPNRPRLSSVLPRARPTSRGRLGTLSGWMKLLLNRRMEQVRDPLTEARLLRERMDEFVFCVQELIPLVFSLDNPRSGTGIPWREINLLLERLVEKTADFRCAAVELDSTSLAAMGREVFRPPACVANGQVIPLEALKSPIAGSVVLDGVPYASRPERSRSLADAVAYAEALLEAAVQGGSTVREESLKGASDLVRGCEELISLFGPVPGKGYRVLHRDSLHEVQYNRAHFALVRGPLRMRNNRHTVIYVGLPILGKTREQRLASAPRALTHPAQLWTSAGVPLVGGLCMGDRRQYMQLLRSTWTEAESIVEWIDAAVILATGRSALHRQRRSRRIAAQRTVNASRR